MSFIWCTNIFFYKKGMTNTVLTVTLHHQRTHSNCRTEIGFDITEDTEEENHMFMITSTFLIMSQILFNDLCTYYR